MTITVIGTGFVGVVTAGVLSSFGHTVYGLDVDPQKVDSLQMGKVPFYEPDLDQLVADQLASGRLHFTTSYQEAIPHSDVVMIAVGTPSAPDGQADLRFVLAAAESAAPHVQPQTIVVVKSTVPPGTNTKVRQAIEKHTQVPFFVASVPEFLREGSAVADTLHPDRVVIGAREPEVIERLSALHKDFHAPIITLSPESAQMAKYTANSYLATRITFINQIADLCEKNGADIMEVIRAIGGDKRIGSHYWYPGFGYGGSCFPKDVKELAAYSRSVQEESNLLNRINELNEQRIYRLMEKYDRQIGGWEGKKVAVLGLSFKPQTDDMREAPSLKVVPYLLSKGAVVNGFDPMAKLDARLQSFVVSGNATAYQQVDAIDQAVQDADVIIALIEWKEITGFDFAAHRAQKPQYIIDARNQLDRDTLTTAGFSYIGVGR